LAKKNARTSANIKTIDVIGARTTLYTFNAAITRRIYHGKPIDNIAVDRALLDAYLLPTINFDSVARTQ
jgi:hypothetical protein